MRLVYRPEAVEDVRLAYRWYEEQRAGLGEAFLGELARTEERISAAPTSYPMIRRRVRRALVRRFPYSLLYRVVGDVIAVVGCFHVRRAPGAARRR